MLSVCAADHIAKKHSYLRGCTDRKGTFSTTHLQAAVRMNWLYELAVVEWLYSSPDKECQRNLSKQLTLLTNIFSALCSPIADIEFVCFVC